MTVTINTTVREVIEKNREVLKVFEYHGVCVEDECPDEVLDFELQDCESMCHIDDVNLLVADLNNFFNEN